MSVNQQFRVFLHKPGTYALVSTSHTTHTRLTQQHTDFLPLLHLFRIIPIQLIKLIRQLDNHRPPTTTHTTHSRNIRTNPSALRPHHFTNCRRLRRPAVHPPKRLQPFQEAFAVPRDEAWSRCRRDGRCARARPGNFQYRAASCGEVGVIGFGQSGFLDRFACCCRGWFGRLVGC